MKESSRLELISNELCCSFYGHTDIEWVKNPPFNTAGGIISIWNNGRFECKGSMSGKGFTNLNGL